MENNLTIVCVSDSHGCNIPLPKGDILIHCGDFSKGGYKKEIEDFINWIKVQPFKYKVVIAGNHDVCLDLEAYHDHLQKRFHRNTPFDEKILLNNLKENCIYLENQHVTIEGYKIFGSPYSLEFCDWAFQLKPQDAQKFWSQIEPETDIVITHGPSYGHGDYVNSFGFKGNVGDKDLLKRIKEIKAKYHLFGHIHEGYGQTEEDGIQFINCSIVNLSYKQVNPPIVIQLPRKQV